MTAILAVLVMFGLVMPLRAQVGLIYYVALGGDDANDGSAARPFRALPLLLPPGLTGVDQTRRRY